MATGEDLTHTVDSDHPWMVFLRTIYYPCLDLVREVGVEDQEPVAMVLLEAVGDIIRSGSGPLTCEDDCPGCKGEA